MTSWAAINTIGFQLPEGQSRYAYLDLAVINPELIAEDEKGNSFRVGPGD